MSIIDTIKSDMTKASKLYDNNCANNNHGPSCFSLGRMYCKCQGFQETTLFPFSRRCCILVSGKGFVTNKEKSKELFSKMNLYLCDCVMIISLSCSNIRKRL